MFVAKLSGEMQALEKYKNILGYEEVLERAEKLLEEAQRLSNKVSEEVKFIEK